VFRAVGKAQVRTGLPVFTHNAVYKAEAHQRRHEGGDAAA
jgi:predicted metal-dependent phosphotriesterase family hydrolase